MPNHVRSDICIKGPRPVLGLIVDFMRGETPFDFNRLCPMPKALEEIHTGSAVINGKVYRRWREIDHRSVGIEPEEIEALALQYGAADWHEWANANWGTKWNAYSVEEPVLTSRSLRYSFDTAWASPERILQLLAEKFDVEISVKVSGEVDERYSYKVAA